MSKKKVLKECPTTGLASMIPLNRRRISPMRRYLIRPRAE